MRIWMLGVIRHLQQLLQELLRAMVDKAERFGFL